MPRYVVDFGVRLFNGSIAVEAENACKAAELVENMPVAELRKHTNDIAVEVESATPAGVDPADYQESYEDRRNGTAHEEILTPGGQALCKVCGPIERPNLNCDQGILRHYHGDSFALPDLDGAEDVLADQG